MEYRNPVISGFYPDPSVIRVEDDYYLVTSTFEYFPGVPVFHSKDLVNWTQIGHCLNRKSQLNLDKIRCSGGIFAPTLRYHKGVFYMVTTNVDGGGNFYVYTDDPKGEWSDPIWVDSNENLGFDPSLLFDGDKVYYHRRYGESVVQTEIDIDTGELLKPMQKIDTGRCSSDIEGPHLYKIGNYYYLLAAEGGTRRGHMITIARSKDPYGPFERCGHNPILTHRHESGTTIRDTGHGELIEDKDGNWWIMFLGTRHYSYDGFTHLGRETFLAPVEWIDDWPVVNSNKSVEVNMNVPNRKDIAKQNLTFGIHENFDNKKLHMSFNYIRNPIESNYNLDNKNKRLGLLGSKFRLIDEDAVTFFGVRQKHFNSIVQVNIDFNPIKDNEEAGVVAVMNSSQYYALGIRYKGRKREIFVRRYMQDISIIAASQIIDDGEVSLIIKSDKDKYHFYYIDDGEERYLTSALCKYLSSELSGGFTGVYLGMYATGNGKESNTWAYFRSFVYRGE